MVMIKWKRKLFYMSNLLNQNLRNYVNGVLNKNTSAVFITDGRSGLGKTTLSFQVGCNIANQVAAWKDINKPLPNGEKHKPNFSLDDVCWTPEEFIERLKTAKEGDVIIMDESMIISSRSAMSQMNKAVVIMMSMIRSKKIFVIFNVNSCFDLDKNLVLHRADMLMHLYAEQDKFAARGNYMVVPSSRGKLKNLYITGKKYYSYSKAQTAFVDHFSSYFPFDEEEYEKRKQEAINNYFKQDKTEVTKFKISRNLYIKYLKDKYNLSTKELGEIGKLNVRTIQRAMSDAKNF